MKTLTYTLILALASLTLFASFSHAQDPNEIMKKSHLAYYYAGDDGLSEVNMVIVDKRGKERTKEFTMLRMDQSEGGPQMYYTYFKKPSDVSRLTFMVHKVPDGNDMRWIYVPSVDLVKPISADDKNSSFVGSNFSYEDVSGRHWSEDNHTLLGDSTIGDRPVWVIESKPKSEGDSFGHKVSYIDKENYLPLMENYYDDKDRLERVFRSEKIDTVDNIVTMTSRSMENVQKGGKTTISFSSIQYNVGLDADVFTERYLKNPPRKYIH
ncbi:MAG TPA: outer membrane lipoprotein-sorting protein [candidate division Zixibacteria bacterium]|nr:outer membrane lipoprotein-sorting protein [candidate division Zixibacteria bacterium]